MSNQYAENIFQAMDTILLLRYNEISYDRTLTCKVINQDEKDKLLYWVTDGNIKFLARSLDNQSYSKNTEVFVVIPEGDYTNEKIITGTRINKTDKSYNQVKYIPTKELLVINNTIVISDSLDIITTLNGVKSGTEFEYSENINFAYNLPIEYIGVEFSLNTIGLFDTTGNEHGIYSILIDFVNESGQPISLNGIDHTIYSTELYGNPYAYVDKIKHFILLPLKIKDNDITKINKVRVKFLQDGNFKQEKIITLSDVSVSFGYEKGSENIGESRLILEKNQSLEYKPDDNNLSRTLYVEWVNNDKIYNHLNPLIDDYNITWFKYVLNHKDNSYFKNGDTLTEEDKKLSINLNLWNWQKIANDKFIYSFNLNGNEPKEQYKAIVWKRNQNTYDFTEIKGLVFINTQVKEAEGAVGEGNGLRLELDLGNTGVYNIYASDGKALNSSTTAKIYNIRAKFIEEGLSIEDVAENGIRWLFPNGNTMILQYISTNGDEEPAAAGLETLYKISSEYRPGAMNNRIWCYIKLKDGRELSASLTLQFGEGSTSGSNYSFNIDFRNNRTCLYSNRFEDIVQVEAQLQDLTGRIMPIDNIVWSWEYADGDNLNTSISGIKFTELNSLHNNIVNLTINKNVNVFEEGNFSILKATIKSYGLENGLTADLIAYLAIPICNNENVHYISGATRGVYGTSNTKLDYSKEKYYLLDINGEDYILEDDKTQVSVLKYQTNPSVAWSLPILETKNRVNENLEVEYTEYSLLLPSYAPTGIALPQLSVIVAEVWALPILIIQNKYGMSLLNEWDGKFTINEKEGYLLSNLLVAGKKDGDNKFTGIVAGDISMTAKPESNEYGTHTGVYGFKNGVNRFRLTDNGEFYIGTNDNNRIHLTEDGDLLINSEKLTIEATTINIDSAYMKLDDKNGIFTLHSQKTGMGNYNTTYFSFNKSTAQIAGFTLTNTGMGKVWQNANGSNRGIWLESEPAENSYFINCIGDTSSFQVKENGSVSLSGEISATSGKATSWLIYQEESFQTPLGELGYHNFKDNAYFGVYSSGSLSILGSIIEIGVDLNNITNTSHITISSSGVGLSSGNGFSLEGGEGKQISSDKAGYGKTVKLDMGNNVEEYLYRTGISIGGNPVLMMGSILGGNKYSYLVLRNTSLS